MTTSQMSFANDRVIGFSAIEKQCIEALVKFEKTHHVAEELNMSKLSVEYILHKIAAKMTYLSSHNTK